MRIFGRKANQQSTTPTAPDVPPELQPYYGKPSLTTRLRRVGMFVLPVIAALALIAALIAGGMWLKHRSDESNHQVATNQSTTQKPATNNNQSQGSSQPQSQSQNQNQNQSGSQSQASEPQPVNNAGSTNNSASQQSSSTSQSSGTSSQSAAPTNIPSTGPDTSMYLLALITASIATVAAYVRQLKNVRR